MRIVIPSVNYADFLAVTLPAWKAFCPEADICVVTDLTDEETVRVACAESDCTLIRTDAWSRDGVLNKAAAMDVAFGFSTYRDTGKPWRQPPAAGEVCLALDADVVPFGKLREHAIRPETMYGCARHACRDPEQLARHVRGELARDHFPIVQSYWRGRRPDPPGLQGFFQCWRYREGDAFGSYPTAARYDVVFGLRFRRRETLETVYVLHLDEHRKNWTGRVTARWPAASPSPSPNNGHVHA